MRTSPGAVLDELSLGNKAMLQSLEPESAKPLLELARANRMPSDRSSERAHFSQSTQSSKVPLHKLPISEHSRRIYLNQSADFLRQASKAFPRSTKAQVM